MTKTETIRSLSSPGVVGWENAILFESEFAKDAFVRERGGERERERPAGILGLCFACRVCRFVSTRLIIRLSPWG